MSVADTPALDRKTAFLRLFDQYARALERLAGAYVAAREDREDLVQEIAAALWQALPGFRAEASERTWLYRIAHNVAITASVRRRKRENREIAPGERLDAPSAGASAEQNLLAEEKRRMLLEAIRQLPAPDRQITVLHLEGLSGAEIAEVAGLAEGSVATRLTRIREKLRRAIRAQEVGDAR
ncbi:MAG TPA: sigma-70 family RNA polymerase sigma factor [Bryobacteraceae bacterium]|nr:sigma-70 family RNA polymerase sigma factor [Bryobacteraceae bacterium]